MYLSNRPVYYTNGRETVAIHYTAHAYDLEEEGWTVVEKEEIDAEEGSNEIDLFSLTKAELIEYADQLSIDVQSNKTKAEIINTILKAEDKTIEGIEE
jgi:hypothetical protein